MARPRHEPLGTINHHRPAAWLHKRSLRIVHKIHPSLWWRFTSRWLHSD